MKTSKLLLALFVGASLLSSQVFAASGWTYRQIGNLGFASTTGTAVNASGRVAGYSATPGQAAVHAFITGANGVGITDLGVLSTATGAVSFSAGINKNGKVVGWSDVPHVNGSLYHGFVTGNNGVGLTDIGTLIPMPGGGYARDSFAYAINDAGRIVGMSSQLDVSYLAYITNTSGTGMQSLGTLGGINSSARAINASGRVTGNSNLAGDLLIHAFITGPNGVGMTDLGTINGNDWSFGTAINASGQVVGDSYNTGGSGGVQAFITDANGANMRDLGNLGGNTTYALGINASGQVVGSSPLYVSAGKTAFITGPNGVGMVDLNTLVTIPDGSLNEAVAINDKGQVVATGSNGNKTYLLTPPPHCLTGW